MSTDMSKIFGSEKVFYEVDGRELRRVRLAQGITALSFAEKCEWPVEYQLELENGRHPWLDLHQVCLIKTALVMLPEKIYPHKISNCGDLQGKWDV